MVKPRTTSDESHNRLYRLDPPNRSAVVSTASEHIFGLRRRHLQCCLQWSSLRIQPTVAVRTISSCLDSIRLNAVRLTLHAMTICDGTRASQQHAATFYGHIHVPNPFPQTVHGRRRTVQYKAVSVGLHELIAAVAHAYGAVEVLLGNGRVEVGTLSTEHLATVPTTKIKKCKGMFLYSTVSSPLDRSERFTLRPLADLFIPTPTRLLWEAF